MSSIDRCTSFTNATSSVAMAWYKRENFERLRRVFEDAHVLHRSFDEWLRDAEKGSKGLEAKGVGVICVDIDPDAFPVWCAANDLRVNAQGRTNCANLIAYKVLTGAQPPDAVQ